MSHRAVKIFNRLVLLAGIITIVSLVWKFSPQQVWADVSQVGVWGSLAILAFQLCDHSCNAVAWRFAFRPEDAAKVPFFHLIKGRMAGDGVNYLTPSGTVAGEFVRPGILDDKISDAAKGASVAVGKLGQALAQALFIMIGILVLVLGKLDTFGNSDMLLGLSGAALLAGLVGLALRVLTTDNRLGDFMWRLGGSALLPIREKMQRYLKQHPIRFALCIVGFIFGYGCGIVEALLIAHFMGLSITGLEAFAIETFSNLIESVFFMVPAKLGTQEAGKAAIFRALGYPVSQGLAFGLIRHVREIIWACAGFAIYAFSVRRRKASALARS